MKPSVMLTVTSLLSIFLLSVHLTGDIVAGYETGTASNLAAIPILAVWLYGTLMFGEKRSGRIIMLLGAILALGMPVLHMKGSGVGGAFAKSNGAFLFIWTLLALGILGTFSLLLFLHGLRKPRLEVP